MRLLNTTTFELRSAEQSIFKQQGYAILSHRWVGFEITFAQLNDHAEELRSEVRPLSTPQLDKIRGACETARDESLEWMWIDNCCIDKTSSVEESESINSMFKWYRDAKLCITYLSDVKKPSDVNALDNTGIGLFKSIDTDRPSVWFTRGWTLQELLAPEKMHFYDCNWEFLGSKVELVNNIQHITGIQTQYLTWKNDFRGASIAKKMSWMAGRETGRIEDIAYSMLGLFGINMVPQYGEGMQAFMRLQHELLSRSTDESMFAWTMPNPTAGAQFNPGVGSGTTWEPDEWGLLAPSPLWFKDSGNINFYSDAEAPRPSQGFSLVQHGMQAHIPWSESVRRFWAEMFCACLGGTLVLLPLTVWQLIPPRSIPFVLNCWSQDDGNIRRHIFISLRVLEHQPIAKLKRERCSELLLKEPRTQLGKTYPAIVFQPEIRYSE